MEPKNGISNGLNAPWPTPKLHRLVGNIVAIRERRKHLKSATAGEGSTTFLAWECSSRENTAVSTTFALHGKQPQFVALEELTAEFRALSVHQLREHDAEIKRKALKGITPIALSTSLSAPTATVMASGMTGDILTLEELNAELSSDAPRTSSQVFNAVWNAAENQANSKGPKAKKAGEALSDSAPKADRDDEESAEWSKTKAKSRIFDEYMKAMTRKASLGEKETLNESKAFRVPACQAFDTDRDKEQEQTRVTKPATQHSWAALASKQSSADRANGAYNRNQTPIDAQVGGPHRLPSVFLTQPVQGVPLTRPLQCVPSVSPLIRPLQTVPLAHPVQGVPLTQPLQGVPLIYKQYLLRSQPVPAHLEHQRPIGQPLPRPQAALPHLDHHHFLGQPPLRSQAVPAHFEHQHQNLQQQRQDIVQPLSWASVALTSPFAMDKLEIGESLYPMVSEFCPNQAGKVTGRLLELGQRELLELMQSPHDLKAKVEEAVAILRAYQQKNASTIHQDVIGLAGSSAAERNAVVVDAGDLAKSTPAEATLSSSASADHAADRVTLWPTVAARPLPAPSVVESSASALAASSFEKVDNDEPLKTAASDLKGRATIGQSRAKANVRVAQDLPSRSARRSTHSREVTSSPISWSSLITPDDFLAQSRDMKSSPNKDSFDSLWDMEELISRELDGDAENVQGRPPSTTADETTDVPANLINSAEDLSRKVEEVEAPDQKDEAQSYKSQRQVLGSLLLPLVQRLVVDTAWAININAVLLQRLDLGQLQQMLLSQDVLVARIREAYTLLQNQQAAYLQQQQVAQSIHHLQPAKQFMQHQLLQQQQQLWQWYQQIQLRPDPNLQLTQRLQELQLAARLDQQRQLQQLQAYQQLQLTQQYLLHQQLQQQAELSKESDQILVASPRSASSAHLDDKELGTAEPKQHPATQKHESAPEIRATSETEEMKEERARELDLSSQSQQQDLLEVTRLSQRLLELQSQVGQPLYYRPLQPDHPSLQQSQLQQQQLHKEEQNRQQYQHMMVMQAASQFLQQQDQGAKIPEMVDRHRLEGPETNRETLIKNKTSIMEQAWWDSLPGSTESGTDIDYQAPEKQKRRNKLADSVSPTDRLLDSYCMDQIFDRFEEAGLSMEDEQESQEERSGRLQKERESYGAVSPQEISSNYRQLEPRNAYTAVELRLPSRRPREDPDEVPDPEILRRLLQQNQKEAELAQRQLKSAQHNMLALRQLQQAQLGITAQGRDQAAPKGFEGVSPAPYSTEAYEDLN